MNKFILDQYISRDQDLKVLASEMEITPETLVNYRKRPHRMPFCKAVLFCRYTGVDIDVLANSVINTKENG